MRGVGLATGGKYALKVRSLAKTPKYGGNYGILKPAKPAKASKIKVKCQDAWIIIIDASSRQRQRIP